MPCKWDMDHQYLCHLLTEKRFNSLVQGCFKPRRAWNHLVNSSKPCTLPGERLSCWWKKGLQRKCDGAAYASDTNSQKMDFVWLRHLEKNGFPQNSKPSSYWNESWSVKVIHSHTVVRQHFLPWSPWFQEKLGRPKSNTMCYTTNKSQPHRCGTRTPGARMRMPPGCQIVQNGYEWLLVARNGARNTTDNDWCWWKMPETAARLSFKVWNPDLSPTAPRNKGFIFINIHQAFRVIVPQQFPIFFWGGGIIFFQKSQGLIPQSLQIIPHWTSN